MSLHRDVLSYLDTLTVTQGPERGEPFEVLPWERRFIRGAFGATGSRVSRIVQASSGQLRGGG